MLSSKEKMEKQKYFIGFELQGQARKDTEKIAEKIVAEFGLNNVFKKYTPHLTFKIPFLANRSEIDHELIPFLEKFVRGRKSITVDLESFGHFNIGVIYRDVIQHDSLLTDLQKELCDGLEQLDWMIFNDIEPNGIPHVTVAEDGVRGRFATIYRFLKEAFSGYCKCEITALHLFEKRGEVWHVVHEFPLET
jgi:2'-5' RNA ligase